MRAFHAVFAAFFLLSGVRPAAQNAETAENAGEQKALPLFPIHRLWEAAREGDLRWRPDWPPAVPPDSFAPLADGARRVTITITGIGREEARDTQNAQVAAQTAAQERAQAGGDGEGDDGAPPAEYTARRDADGRLTAFPFLRDGVFTQAEVRYDRNREIAVLTLAAAIAADGEAAGEDGASPGGEAVEVTLLETVNGLPRIARIASGGAFYFAAFTWTAGAAAGEYGECIEMWTDEAGAPLAILSGGPTLYHDSMRNITAVSGGGIDVSARYHEKGVRYWNSGGKELAFQRDERGLVVRLTEAQSVPAGSPPLPDNGPETGEPSFEPPVNYSYEYTFDRNGTWIERREIRWTPLHGFLAPSAGDVVTRVIDYR
jgi:hypothetical protein